MNLNKTVGVVGLVAGTVAGCLNLVLYNKLSAIWGGPLLIAFLIVVFALIVCEALFAVMLITGESDEEFLFLSGKGPLLIGLVVSLLLTFGMGMFLEFLYDRNTKEASVPTAYVFLLDESGSMEANDSTLERYNAVNMLMDSMPADVPYAVYMFADETVCVRELAPASAGKFYPGLNVANSIGAQTMIKGGLEYILNDISSGNLSGYSGKMRVILLTDGMASDMSKMFGSNAIVKAYKAERVGISAVGLGQVDERLLRKITKKTGGVYVPIQNAEELSQGFAEASAVDVSRDLLSTRYVPRHNWLYALLRILFLTILGAAVAFMKALGCAKEDDTVMILLVGAAAALLGAIIVEISSALTLPVWIGQIIYWILLSLTPVTKPVRRGSYDNMPIYGLDF